MLRAAAGGSAGPPNLVLCNYRVFASCSRLLGPAAWVAGSGRIAAQFWFINTTSSKRKNLQKTELNRLLDCSNQSKYCACGEPRLCRIRGKCVSSDSWKIFLWRGKIPPHTCSVQSKRYFGYYLSQFLKYGFLLSGITFRSILGFRLRKVGELFSLHKQVRNFEPCPKIVFPSYWWRCAKWPPDTLLLFSDSLTNLSSLLRCKWGNNLSPIWRLDLSVSKVCTF